MRRRVSARMTAKEIAGRLRRALRAVTVERATALRLQERRCARTRATLRAGIALHNVGADARSWPYLQGRQMRTPRSGGVVEVTVRGGQLNFAA